MRKWKICSSFENFTNEVETIKLLLRQNGFPIKYLNCKVRKFIQNKNRLAEVKLPVFGPEKRMVLIGLPFCGQNSSKLSRQLSRVIDKLVPCVKFNILFKPTFRLQTCSKLKSLVPVLNKSNVVYRINCADCQEFYIGLTTRRLHRRIEEHKKSKQSAIYNHASDTGHNINFNNPEILTL